MQKKSKPIVKYKIEKRLEDGRKVAAPAKEARNIVWLCSECTPYAKSGGLADVSGALPDALASRGHKVTVIMPYYPQLMTRFNNTLKVRHRMLGVPFRGGIEWAQILEHPAEGGISRYFIEFHKYYDRPSLYDWNNWEFGDNADRFIFFCRAAMEAIRALGISPDIIHANDWHSALACVYLRSGLYNALDNFSRTASVLTIHNLAYQGDYHKNTMPLTGLGWEYFNYHCLEYYDRVNLLKGGIMTAHMVNTVSPSYALETLSPEGGYGLDGPLRERAFNGAYRGIINGVDSDVWNPETDPLIPKNYSAGKIRGKDACKAGLQKEFGLPVRPDVPLFGIVSRLAYQKGIDIFADAVEDMLKYDDAQFAVLGSGEPQLHDRLSWFCWKYPEKFRAWIGYNEKYSHMIEAGSDFFVMPSRYEPCGLNQMYSMLYGTAPVVRATGGLEDTVANFDPSSPEKSSGFKFWDLNPGALLGTMRWAASVYRDRPIEFKRMRSGMMRQDFSWNHTAALYEELYKDAIGRV